MCIFLKILSQNLTTFHRDLLPLIAEYAKPTFSSWFTDFSAPQGNGKIILWVEDIEGSIYNFIPYPMTLEHIGQSNGLQRMHWIGKTNIQVLYEKVFCEFESEWRKADFRNLYLKFQDRPEYGKCLIRKCVIRNRISNTTFHGMLFQGEFRMSQDVINAQILWPKSEN